MSAASQQKYRSKFYGFK